MEKNKLKRLCQAFMSKGAEAEAARHEIVLWLRVEAGASTQKAVAKSLDVSQQYLSDVLKLKRKLSDSIITSIAKGKL